MLIQKPISKAEVSEWAESQKKHTDNNKKQTTGFLDIKRLSSTVGNNSRVNE